MRAVNRTGRLLLTAAAVVGLTGCTAGAGDAGRPTETVTVTATVTATAPPTDTDTADACGPASAEEAAAEGIAALPAPGGPESATWDAATADYSGYDPCAALSWSLVTVKGGTGSSPTAILLFHAGSYLGTATATQYGFTPAVDRTSDAEIAVAYRYVQADEANADASGRADATFTWNPETEGVTMTGDVPPEG